MYEEFMGRLCFVCDLETICERYSAVGHLAAQIAIQALGCGADLSLCSQSSKQLRLRGPVYGMSSKQYTEYRLNGAFWKEPISILDLQISDFG